MKRFRIGALILSLLIPLAVGGVSALLTMQNMAAYSGMNKPPLSPPAWVFPVAWTILYIMMGLASYFIFVADADPQVKRTVMIAYAVQLAMNFMWSIVFFNLSMYLAAFIWLVIMWVIVIFCAVKAKGIDRNATYLLVPYILWLTFAAYLNMGVYVLN